MLRRERERHEDDLGSKGKMIHVFYNKYTDSNPERDDELTTALNRNLELPIYYHQLLGRPTFTDIFSQANTVSDGDIAVIINSDCFLVPESLPPLEAMPPHHVYALTRWDVQKDGSLKFFAKCPSQSADCWAFRVCGPPIVLEYPQGTPACDQRLARLIHDSGWEISNPSLTIRVAHLHHSRVRRYSIPRDNVPPPYWPVPPCELA